MASSLVYQFLDVNVLNYCYFHANCLTFFLNKKRWKNKKNAKKRVFYRKIKKNVYKRLLQLCTRMSASKWRLNGDSLYQMLLISSQIC